MLHYRFVAPKTDAIFSQFASQLEGGRGEKGLQISENLNTKKEICPHRKRHIKSFSQPEHTEHTRTLFGFVTQCNAM